MEKENQNLNSEPRPAGVGLGERLQAARIQQGMSVDDVAGRMHLNVAIVKSIEENNFDDITAPIFVKGYLRAYARIVSLNEEEMIQQYASYYSHEDPPIATTSNMAPELSVADVRIKWTTYLVILGLAALLAAWWWNKNQGETTPISLDSQGSDEQVVPLDTDGRDEPLADRLAGSSEPAGEPMASAEPASPGEPLSSEPEAPQTAVTQAPEAVVTEPPAAQSGTSATTSPEPITPPAADQQAESPAEAVADGTQSGSAAATSTDEAQTAAAAEPEPIEEAAAEPAPGPSVRLGAPALVAPSGTDKMLISVTADTWADIKDGNDFQMVYHLLRAGQSLELTGSAPFSVFLGNGRGVEIRFNDEEIEFSGRIRNDNTTRLSIGG